MLAHATALDRHCERSEAIHGHKGNGLLRCCVPRNDAMEERRINYCPSKGGELPLPLRVETSEARS
jgi:hypothetical protein